MGKSFRAVAVNGLTGSRLLRVFLSIVLAMSMSPASSAFANEVSLEGDVEQEIESGASAEAVELTENGYIVDWTESGTCEWSIDAEGNLVVRPADGAPSGVFSSSSWRNYWQEIKTARFSGVVRPKNARALFWGCSSLTSVDLTGLDTSESSSMCRMFEGCSSLTSVDLSSLDTSNVTDMYGMFYECSSLESIDLSLLDTSKVTDMTYMFRECRSLKSVNLSGLNTSKVEGMRGMFEACKQLASM